MTFKDQLTTDLSVFFNTDEFAQTVTYKGTPIAAIVDYGENPGKEGDALITLGTLTVKASDVPSPAYRDTVVIGSNTWRVRGVISGDGYIWKLSIYRGERPSW